MGARGWILGHPAAALTVLAITAGLATAVAFGRSSDEERTPLVSPGLRVGLVANTLEGGLGREQDVVRRLGVRWIREELWWPDLERRRGRLDWSQIDRVFHAAARRRMQILPLLNGTPRWLARQGTALPPDAAAWGGFVAAAVARYGPGGRFWRDRPGLDPQLAPRVFELWNEPYFTSFSYGGPDPARFATIVRAGVQAGRRANRHVRYLVPAEATYNRRDGTHGNWLDDLFAAAPDLGRYADAFAVHPYSAGDPASAGPDPRLRFGRLADIRDNLRGRGLGDRKVWITELGWSTCMGSSGCVTEAQQARYLRRAFQLVRDHYAELVDALFVYHLRSGRPVRGDVLPSYGLLRFAGTRKPAWSVVRRAAQDAG